MVRNTGILFALKIGAKVQVALIHMGDVGAVDQVCSSPEVYKHVSVVNLTAPLDDVQGPLLVCWPVEGLKEMLEIKGGIDRHIVRSCLAPYTM